jgi:hypothetical protein
MTCIVHQNGNVHLYGTVKEKTPLQVNFSKIACQSQGKVVELAADISVERAGSCIYSNSAAVQIRHPISDTQRDFDGNGIRNGWAAIRVNLAKCNV